MDFDTSRVISSAVFGICAGLICCSLTSDTTRKKRPLIFLLSLASAAAGLWGEAAAYPSAVIVLTAALTVLGTDIADSLSIAALSSIASVVIIVFSNALIAPSLEAYSYTLRTAFYYSVVNSSALIIAAVAAVLVLPLLIWLCRKREGTGSTLAMGVIALSLSAATVMIIHMCAGQLIDYNAKYFRLPTAYSALTGAIAVICAAITCVFTRLMRRILTLPGSLGETKEFYMILTAAICTVTFYCYENTILNNYTTFDDPRYKYTVSILIVLMILTILAALFAVCSYILRTRAKQSMIEREAEITSIYRNEIKDMQRDIFDFKHDYVKIYSSMSAFIINEEYDKLSEFFDKNIAPLQKELFDMDEDSRSLGLIEDGAVQGLVYSYIIKAKKVGVTILTDIRDPVPTVSVPVLDLNRLLGIFLDNAIEQAAQNGSEVGFAAIPDEDSVLFVITNRAEGVDIERMFNRGESTKGNGRGRGLAIARKLCSAHDDLSLHTYIKDKKFICEIYADL